MISIINMYIIYIYTSSKPLGYRTLFPQRLFQPRSIHFTVPAPSHWHHHRANA